MGDPSLEYFVIGFAVAFETVFSSLRHCGSQRLFWYCTNWMRLRVVRIVGNYP